MSEGDGGARPKLKKIPASVKTWQSSQYINGPQPKSTEGNFDLDTTVIMSGDLKKKKKSRTEKKKKSMEVK